MVAMHDLNAINHSIADNQAAAEKRGQEDRMTNDFRRIFNNVRNAATGEGRALQ